MKSKLLYIILLFAICNSNAVTLITPKASTSTSKANINDAQLKLNQDLRKLWSDHVFYTRNYIISAIAKLPDVKAVLERLLKNQEDLGNAIVPYYGADAGKQLTKLLQDHIKIAGDLVAAAIVGDKVKVNDANSKWTDNAKQIAQFLSGANPKNWTVNGLTDMLNKHLELTKNEATYRLKPDWVLDVKNFDAIYAQALQMADALSDGIVKQFPDKFA